MLAKAENEFQSISPVNIMKIILNWKNIRYSDTWSLPGMWQIYSVGLEAVLTRASRAETMPKNIATLMQPIVAM